MGCVRAKNNRAGVGGEGGARWERKLEMADMHLASQKLGASRSRRARARRETRACWTTATRPSQRAIRPDAPLLYRFPTRLPRFFCTSRAQSMRPLSVRVMSVSLEMTCATPPQPGRAVPVNPASRHCEITSKSSSELEIRLVHRLAHAEQGLLVVTTHHEVIGGAIAPMRSMPVMKGASASKPATTGSA